MEQLSNKIPICVPLPDKGWRHRGGLFSFDPLENLENSKCTGKKTIGCSSCSSILSEGSKIVLSLYLKLLKY